MKGKSLRIEPSAIPERKILPGIECFCRIKPAVKFISV